MAVASFRELMSCSEDGSVRMWEIQDLPLQAEPASPGTAAAALELVCLGVVTCGGPLTLSRCDCAHMKGERAQRTPQWIYLLLRDLVWEAELQPLHHLVAKTKLYKHNPSPTLSPAPGFFGLWSFGRSSKQMGPQSKKAADPVTLKTLELTGDLIGHSGAVQVCFHQRSRTT